jgi:putative pyruvate formate lyase activating enzyme
MDSIEKIKKIEQALDSLSAHERACQLCPRECGADRQGGEKGFCQSGRDAAASHAILHYGEEPILSGAPDDREAKTPDIRQLKGSGTIFFAGCNLKCCFCQNYQLSWLGQGKAVAAEELARMMIRLQAEGALNINLVSPSHLILPILRALRSAYQLGLAIPLVYNSNGYEKADVIRQLEGIIDIYLPDLKYFSAEAAQRYSAAPDYFSHASRVIREMHRQKPRLVLDETEIAREGLVIRHLVLPGLTKDSVAILEWLAQSFSSEVCLSLMSQYHPCFNAPEELQRPLRPEEYQEVLARAEELGFETMFIQPEVFSPEDHLIPDFSLPEPFPWARKAKEE